MTPSPVSILPAADADIDALADLLALLFTLEQDFTPDHASQRKGLALLLAQPETAHVLVAKDAAGAVLGMVSVQLVISTAQGARSAWVEDLIVHPLYRRRGLASRLLDAALAWASSRGATRAQLLADADNPQAQVFYDVQGWDGTHLKARRVMLTPVPD